MATHVIVFADALGLENFDLFGFSLGGFVAQQVTLDRPNLVHRLILAGTGPEGGEAIGGYPPSITERATRQVPIEDDFLHLFFSPTPTSQAAGRAFWKRRHERKNQDVLSSPAAMAAQAEAIGAWGVIPNQNRYAQLKRIEQPTLIVNGRDDVMVPTINSYILQQQLPNATLIIYPDSGHGAIFQFPQLFMRHATMFLRGDQAG